ncbi:hypothetical protein HNQ09_001408 [Deinococcus budaensis]|uniref:Uncharacterized protein n=1 Tax=Deinococcus budaensis TaxID=1665626 RepID=A0A7W8GE97_9DEIO|nr:hypothetical protein [Deinococcus budaensis]MBB5233970.1 hypothetical protein [Deinococcus budaensis]
MTPSLIFCVAVEVSRMGTLLRDAWEPLHAQGQNASFERASSFEDSA